LSLNLRLKAIPHLCVENEVLKQGKEVEVRHADTLPSAAGAAGVCGV